MNDDPTPDDTDITRDLGDAAASIDTGDATAMLTSVRTTATRRRRRRQTVIGVAAAGVLVASGVVVANLVDTGGNGDELFVSSSADHTATTATTDVVDTEPDPSVPGESVGVPPADATPVRLVPATGQQVADPGVTVEADDGWIDTQLFEWNDGFLAIRTTYGPQPLPAELPQEVIDRFPPEVVELFADGLPPTIEEATTMLEDAGLFDVVADIVTSDPEVSEAIYSGESNVTTTVRFSPDGLEWSDIDNTIGDYAKSAAGMSSTGDRFVMAVQAMDAGAPFDERAGPSTVEIVSTTDLMNWTTQTVDLPARPADLSEHVDYDVYPDQIVASPDGWLLQASSHTSLDYLSLVPEERLAGIDTTQGYGSSSDETGFTINGYDEVDGVTSTGPDELKFTWEEVGLTGDPSQDVGNGSNVRWFAPWNGDATQVATTDGNMYGGGQIVAVDGGFVVPTESGVSFSTDGGAGTVVDLPVGGYVQSLMPVGSTVVAFVQSDSDGEPSQFLLDTTTMTWTELAIDGLPERFQVEQAGDGAALLADYGGDDFVGSAGSVATAEVDGYRFELTVMFDGETATASYVLTDVATGDEISTETTDELGDEFEFAKETYDIDDDDLEGFRASDPATGEELVAIPYDVMDYQSLDADGNPVGDSFEVETGEVTPSYWILATDGTSWLIDQVVDGDDPENTGDPGFGNVVVVDGVVLAARSDGTFVRSEL